MTTVDEMTQAILNFVVEDSSSWDTHTAAQRLEWIKSKFPDADPDLLYDALMAAAEHFRLIVAELKENVALLEMPTEGNA